MASARRDLIGQGVEAFLPPRHQRQLGALRSEGARSGLTDATARAGHQSYRSLERSSQGDQPRIAAAITPGTFDQLARSSRAVIRCMSVCAVR
jgi:hypothetical protein